MCIFLKFQLKETWHPLYRRNFLKKSLSTVSECRKGFYYYQRGFTESGVSFKHLLTINGEKIYCFSTTIVVCHKINRILSYILIKTNIYLYIIYTHVLVHYKG